LKRARWCESPVRYWRASHFQTRSDYGLAAGPRSARRLWPGRTAGFNCDAQPLASEPAPRT
jgi:hypothetical protein